MFHTPLTWMPQVHVAVRLGGATALLRWQVLPKMALVDPCVATLVLVSPEYFKLALAVAHTAGHDSSQPWLCVCEQGNFRFSSAAWNARTFECYPSAT